MGAVSLAKVWSRQGVGQLTLELDPVRSNAAALTLLSVHITRRELFLFFLEPWSCWRSREEVDFPWPWSTIVWRVRIDSYERLLFFLRFLRREEGLKVGGRVVVGVEAVLEALLLGRRLFLVGGWVRNVDNATVVSSSEALAPRLVAGRTTINEKD